MTTKYTSYKIDIVPLSPLHIGSGEAISAVGEFITTQNNIIFLDNEKLITHIHAEGKLNDYTAEILSAGNNTDFYEVLKEWSIDPRKFQSKEVKLHQNGQITNDNNELHLCIKTDRQAYIPGSSLKGLIRTAMLFRYLRKHPQEIRDLESAIEESDHLRTISRYWQNQEKEILPDVVAQALRPYDSTGIPDDQMVIEQVNRQHFYGIESENLDWLVECIRPGAELSFELTFYPHFDAPEFDYLKKNSIEDIFSMINDFSRTLINDEINRLQSASSNTAQRNALIRQLNELLDEINQSENKFAIARMGKGKTLFFQTILTLLSESARQKVISLLPKKPEEASFPQSRVLTAGDPENPQMLGWIKLGYQKPQKQLYNNEVPNIIEKETRIKVHFSETKKVDLMINGEIFENIQLINKFKRSFSPGELISVTIWQLNKAGKIVQVKLS